MTVPSAGSQETLLSERSSTERCADSGRCCPANLSPPQKALPASISRDPIENRLLAALPREGFERLLPHLELTQLAKGDILYEPGDLIRYAYFPCNGMLSLLATTEEGMAIEVGVVGNEGMVGTPILLGVGLSLYQVIVQVPSKALRITTEMLKAAVKQEQYLQKLLLRYTHSLLVQVSQAVICSHFHTLEQRLCRRLLTAQDCVNQDTFQLTQELLSQLLGARRTGVTQAAGALQEAGLIRYRWGRITIIDRPGLEAVACECYQIVKQELC